MEISIVSAQIIRARESVEGLLGDEPSETEHDQISEALDALLRAEASICSVLMERSTRLGKCLSPHGIPRSNQLKGPQEFIS